jgi:acyl carrier protein
LRHESVSLEVVRILREELQAAELTPFPAMELSDMPGWDSVNMSCVVVALEGRFGIEFNGAELETLSTFGKLVDLVSTKAGSA